MDDESDEEESDNTICSALLTNLQPHFALFIQQGGYLLPPALQFNTWLRTLPLIWQLQLSQCYRQQISGTDEASEPTCWFVIPTITEERQETVYNFFGLPTISTVRTNIEVQENYLTVQDISTNENTTINVYDLIEGKNCFTETLLLHLAKFLFLRKRNLNHMINIRRKVMIIM